jgi:hypothetical protein
MMEHNPEGEEKAQARKGRKIGSADVTIITFFMDSTLGMIAVG